MKLTTAIEELERQIDPFAMPQDKDCQDALQIGIEAMKAWREFREDGWLPGHELLPGETKE